MKRSIILYTYNSEKYIVKLLGSILDQMDDENDELIIIDDLSTDNTVPIIVDLVGFMFADEEHYKFYINNAKKGKKSSVEMGKKIATGDYKLTINKKMKVRL